ncbi:MAG: hypothetical protein HY903_00130 [Deltaproteobacteria bacterium]|nr:hypothetical protein [Deltaproteobacteria bacterium]
MKRSVAICLLGVVGGCTPATAPATPATPEPPVRATASVDKAVATTGDVLTYQVTVDHDAGLVVSAPEPGANIAGMRITDTGAETPVTKNGRTTMKRWYKLRADLVGSYVLPPVVVRYTPRADAAAAVDGSAKEPAAQQTVSTSEIFIEVKSVLPKDGEAKDIRDLKPLAPLPRARWPYVAGSAALVAALVIGLALWWRRRHRKALVVPPPPPHEVAYAALDLLRQTDFSRPEAVRQYYYGLSEILRTYVEGRFTLNATDLTTEEILPRLTELPQLPAAERVTLKEFLFATDAVKYTTREPTKTDIEQAYEKALAFVEATALTTPVAPTPIATA